MLSQGVLVLNRNWTAVHVCSVKRALSLLCQDMARVVDNDYQMHDFDSWRELSQVVAERGNHYVHSPSFRMLVPEVIILTRFGRVPPRAVKFNRRNIYMRDSHTCQYCGRKPAKDELTIDHILPRSRGGRSTWENVALACQQCNTRKGDKLLDEIGMKLLKPARRPHWLATLRYTLKGLERPTWQKFVDVAYWNVALEED
jgi:5-methylcytosine-specific restriction endonuclease McrA